MDRFLDIDYVVPWCYMCSKKEEADNEVPLVRLSQDDPLNPSSTRNDQVDSDNNNLGESNMIKEKFIKNP